MFMTGKRCLSLSQTIAMGTLVAGTLDIAWALISSAVHGGHPAGVLRFIAACLVGRGAMKGGIGIEWLGLGIHYCIAGFWTAVYVLASLRIGVLRLHACLSGVFYGLFIYLVMNLLVLPNTTLHVHISHAAWAVVNTLAPLVLCVGLPVALINTRRCPP